LIMGLVVFSSIGFVINRLGVGVAHSIAFSLLSGIATMAFVLRERGLMNRITDLERHHLKEVGVLSDRMEHLYGHSPAAIVQFDAGTLLVDRASAGFLDLLDVAAERGIRGRRLEEILGVDSIALERFAEDVRMGGDSRAPVLNCRTASGDKLRLLISGHLDKERNLIEAVLVPTLPKDGGKYEFDRALGDLERFRHGMARREQRILELKAEVNELLGQARRPARYQVDIRTEERRLAQIDSEVSKRGRRED